MKPLEIPSPVALLECWDTPVCVYIPKVLLACLLNPLCPRLDALSVIGVGVVAILFLNVEVECVCDCF